MCRSELVHFKVTLLKMFAGKEQTVACLCKFVRLHRLVHLQVLMCLSVLSGCADRCSPPSEKDLCLSIYRMPHLHIFVVHPSACGLFCGGISSENQCCHGWMYVAPGSARVGSPTRGSGASPIYMSPVVQASNLKAGKHISQRAQPRWAGRPRRSSSLPVCLRPVARMAVCL